MKEKRTSIFYFAIILLGSLLAFRLFQLQVLNQDKYKMLARENASRTMPIVAPRGIIYDTAGNILLKNRPVFSVYLAPHNLPLDPEPVLSQLAGIIDLPYDQIKEKLENKKRSRRFGNIKIASDLPLSAVSLLYELQDQLPGVEVSCYPLRHYPLGSAGIHVLGYIGEIEMEEIRPGFRMGDLVGKDGIEKEFDRFLRGIAGGTRIEVDVRGRPVRQIEALEPELGNDVHLTLDLELQQAADKALGYYRGAVVVMDPRSGAVLALASHPAYDPNKPWTTLSQRYHPFMNRALTAYPPGSTFKVITLAAALQEKRASLSELFTCHGSYQLGARVARCWKETGHGTLNAAEGLVWSCDVVFYELGRRLGPDLLCAYAQKFGLGTRTGIDLPREKKGLIPNEAWKKDRLKEKWYEGDSINMGIGQGFIQVTPLQLAALYGFIGTGRLMKPYLVKEVRSKKGEILYQAVSREVASLPMGPDVWLALKKALTEVVGRGTGRVASVPGFPAAGKTGTAENPGLPHAWFVCYAPFDDPEIVISAFVEHGEHGDRTAALVAHDILAWYKDHRLKRVIEATGPPPL